MANRKMPQNLEAEMSVLSACLLMPSAADKVCENLIPDMFFSDANRKIFEAIFDLHEGKHPIDYTTLTNELEKNNTLALIGGIEYLSDVVDAIVSAANLDFYINIVQEKYLRRRLIEVSTNITTSAYEEASDTNDVVDNAEKQIFTVTKERKAGEFKSISEVLRSTQARIEFLAKNGSAITGLPTGFTDIDIMTSGLHENELIIIAARPAMGKTAFAINLAVNAALSTPKAVAIFNLEMGAEQLAERMIGSVGGIDLKKLKTGDLSDKDWQKVNEAMSELGETNIYIEDTSGITVGDIRAKCRRLANSEKGLALVIIDYLQLIQGGARYAGNRQQEVSEISRSLKTMALELKVPVIALAQLSRAVELREDKRPIMSDLRESGSIEQDADIVAFLYRDDYYNPDKHDLSGNTSVTEFIVGKHRSGNTGTVELLFEKNLSNFADYVKREEELPNV
ncbi:MAG: replicative DNA helicase [Bacilli bacterium]|nr:replicative DNA helicase [Bacilli bacterium]